MSRAPGNSRDPATANGKDDIALLPVSRFFPLEHSVNPPVGRGEFIRLFFLAARERLSDALILELIEEYGGGRHDTLDDYLLTLKPCPHVPASFFCPIAARLAREGVDISRVPEIGLEQRGNSQLFLSMILFIISYAVRQPVSPAPVDLVSCALMAQKNYHPMVVNYRLVDVNLESRSGPRRTARLWLLHLCPEGITSVPALEYREILKLLPTPFREPAGVVSHPVQVDGCWMDHRGDESLPVGVRPSLTQTAEERGLELEVRGKDVLMDGVKAAVQDHDPERVVTKGIYRMTADVYQQGGKMVIKPPRSPFRPSEGRLLLSGHRYHLERPLVFQDFLVSYTVKRPLHLAILVLLKASSMIWGSIGGRKMPDPWADVLDVIGRGREDHVPSADNYRPRASDRVAGLAAKHGLTRREKQILVMVVQGRSNRQIAAELEIEESTVKSHMNSILSKTGKKNRQVLIASLLSGPAPDDDTE